MEGKNSKQREQKKATWKLSLRRHHPAENMPKRAATKIISQQMFCTTKFLVHGDFAWNILLVIFLTVSYSMLHEE